jgi:hypothetical protein
MELLLARGVQIGYCGKAAVVQWQVVAINGGVKRDRPILKGVSSMRPLSVFMAQMVKPQPTKPVSKPVKSPPKPVQPTTSK